MSDAAIASGDSPYSEEPPYKRRRTSDEHPSLSPDHERNLPHPLPDQARGSSKATLARWQDTERGTPEDASFSDTESHTEEADVENAGQTGHQRSRTSKSHTYSMHLGVPDAHNAHSPAEDTDPASSPIPSPAPVETPKLNYKPCLILRGHKRGVATVRFSPNGNLIASGSADSTVKVWSANTGRHLHTLCGHLAGISTVAWSPDSAVLATGSDDKTIRLWNVNTGKPFPHAFVGHHNYVYSLAFSPKGNILVSGSYDEAVFLWDVRTGRIMRSLPAHSDPVCGVDFVRDGTLIASCASDGLIRVWDTPTGQCLRTFFHEDTPPATAVRFSPNGKYILAWMLDSSIRMWNYVEGRCVKTYQGHTNTKFSLGGAFATYGDPEQAMIVSGSEDGNVFFWDVNLKNILQRLEECHEGPVLAVDAFAPDRSVVTCGLDRTVKVWRDESDVAGASSAAPVEGRTS
ncbi:MAG: WD domain protein [Alyxoria varia]|nr:MAG: WD domain protein [Alyxoria varia]